METETTKTTPATIALEFVTACSRDGWRIEARDGVVTIYKAFAPGDRESYVACDMTAYGLLSMCPLKCGSVWGTDGGSIGGMAGLNGGYYKLNKSGNGGKRFIAEVNKLIGR